MWSTYKATVIALVRSPQIMVWTAIFPIVLATIFSFMFGSFSNDGRVDAVPVAVVADDAWSASPFADQVDELSKGNDALLETHEVPSLAKARELLDSGEVRGAYVVDGDAPRLILSDADASGGRLERETNRAILEAVATSYVQGTALTEELAARGVVGSAVAAGSAGATGAASAASERDRASAPADPADLAEAFSLRAGVRSVSLTHAAPDQTVRYYYALLGMAALFGSMLSTWAVTSALPTASALGARRFVAPVRHAAQMTGILLGSWTVSLACLFVAFAYMDAVVGIDFAGREALCAVGLAAASLLSIAIGALVGALPLRDDGVRSGINTAIACVGSLFAGLYGQPSVAIGDAVARAVPASSWVNPARLISDLFYSLYYYDSLAPFALRAAACAGVAALLLAVSATLLGRGSYEHL